MEPDLSPIFELLRRETREQQQLRRARAVNLARKAGLSWAAIAESLGMTQAGVQRSKGVDSPWNRENGVEIVEV